MICKRSNSPRPSPGKQAQIWAIAEGKYGAQLLCAVDNVYGTVDEHKSWMKEVGITPPNYFQLNTMIHFFALEEDGAMFYLRWGKQ